MLHWAEVQAECIEAEQDGHHAHGAHDSGFDPRLLQFSDQSCYLIYGEDDSGKGNARAGRVTGEAETACMGLADSRVEKYMMVTAG